MIKVKICGLSRETDIKYANELLPDYIGFVFAEGRRRYIKPQTAAGLKSMLSDRVKAVGVFVNESSDVIEKIAADGTIDIIQLHGTEDDAYIKELHRLTGLPIIKAFKTENASAVETAEGSAADYILFDNGSGGTGESFNWSLVEKIKRPYFLAGGINCTNLKRALSELRPYGIDVSSGVETGGLKDYNKMKEIIRIARETKGAK